MAKRPPGRKVEFVRDQNGNPVVGLRTHKKRQRNGEVVDKYYAKLPTDVRRLRAGRAEAAGLVMCTAVESRVRSGACTRRRRPATDATYQCREFNDDSLEGLSLGAELFRR